MAERSPTLTLIGVFAVVYLLQTALGLFGAPRALFALAPPVAVRPWTLVTSVYAHGSVRHLLANTIALALLGLFLERGTSRARFHLFFLVTGALAGLAEIWVGLLLGDRVAVLGASGAIFALLGYLLAGNRVSDTVFGRFSIEPRVQLLVFVLVAGALAIVTDGHRVALVAHFTGLLLGLLAGRAHLLRTG